jgi:signal transduction histidine kinase/CheY-like chemotaxis protein
MSAGCSQIARTEDAVLSAVAGTLDQLELAFAVFDENDICLQWNTTFLTFFPEHAGRIRRGEHYRENLRRFYEARLGPDELHRIERYVADGLARHRNQAWPYEFSHRGRWLRVASLPMEGGGRTRIWTAIPAPETAEPLAAQVDHGGHDAVVSSIDHIADGVMIRDSLRRIVAVNRRFRALYGVAIDTPLVGQTFEAVAGRAWSDQPGWQEAAVALTDNSRFVGAPYEISLPNDRRIRISERKASDGGDISIHVDITSQYRLQRTTAEAQARAEALAGSLKAEMEERQRAEAALRHAQRAEVISHLTAGVAHDFNNLFSAMLTNLEILTIGGTRDADLARFDLLKAIVERGATLTRQLLAFARSQSLAPAAVSLRDVFARVVPLLRTVCGPTVRSHVEIPGELPAVFVDQAELELAILNLAINARDAMPAGGDLFISAMSQRFGPSAELDSPETGDYVVLTVADTGHGMAEELRARAIEPFFTTKGPGGGSGLGLSHAFGFMRQLGGTLRIDSAPGMGTKVHLVLPIAEAQAGQSTDTTPKQMEPGNARLLLVDDDPAILNGLAELLALLGYDVTPAATPQLACDELLSGAAFDLLITDVRMPGMSGTDLAAWAWEFRPTMPVLFLTGYAPPDALARLKGNYRVMSKPYRTAGVQAAIGALLGLAPGESREPTSIAT